MLAPLDSSLRRPFSHGAGDIAAASFSLRQSTLRTTKRCQRNATPSSLWGAADITPASAISLADDPRSWFPMTVARLCQTGDARAFPGTTGAIPPARSASRGVESRLAPPRRWVAKPRQRGPDVRDGHLRSGIRHDLIAHERRRVPPIRSTGPPTLIAPWAPGAHAPHQVSAAPLRGGDQMEGHLAPRSTMARLRCRAHFTPSVLTSAVHRARLSGMNLPGGRPARSDFHSCWEGKGRFRARALPTHRRFYGRPLSGPAPDAKPDTALSLQNHR